MRITGPSILAAAAITLFIPSVHASDELQSLNSIMSQVKKLEDRRDPKCYATASRLEDFIYGTPLDDDARFTKNILQKAWIHTLWQRASFHAKSQGAASVTAKNILAAAAPVFQYARNNDWKLTFKTGRSLTIGETDQRHYSSVAYALRALMAVEQDAALLKESDLLPLDETAVEEAKKALDLFTLAVLQLSDNEARAQNRYEITAEDIKRDWALLLPANIAAATPKPAVAKEEKPQIKELTLLKAIINQKIASFAAYNDVNNQLFVRNMQVYFARMSWPKEEAEAKAFRNLFTETLINFAQDLYLQAQKVAMTRGHATISEADVHDVILAFIPHKINEYEDAIFFPKLPKAEQITLEAYDMDAFRDSGLHWKYLEYAIDTPKLPTYLEPDPFAAELISENIAQFGVLILRATGNYGRGLGETRLKSAYFIEAMKQLQDRISKHGAIKTQPAQETQKLASATTVQAAKKGDDYFTDVTDTMGIHAMHRSSDWLNRMLRSYLKKDEHRGTITIPPAFGGAGVAGDDINNDGYPDLLILSGLGNKLYLNRGGKHFEDVSDASGLNWKRPDGHAGEPRQPLIADLDNDGYKDIIITYVNDAHRVFRNKGDGTFEDVSSRSPLGGKDVVGGPAALIDIDNDGLLDLYVTYFGDYIRGVLPTLKRRNDNGRANQLFKNMGNFTFKNITEGSGVDDSGWAQAITHTDFNGDGLQDIILGNDFGVNSYFQNLGNGKFKDVAYDLGTDKPSYTMSMGLADLNDDFAPDIYISNIVTMNKDEKYVLPTEEMPMKFNPDKLANMRVIEANDLFLSDGKDHYTHSNLVGRGYSTTGWSWDADFFDFDNDGDDDLYVVNGMNEFNLYSSENPYYADPNGAENAAVHIPVSPKERNVFFVNEAGMLQNHSKESGTNLLSNSRSAAYLDFDRDGDLDIILNNYHQEAVLYRNNAEKAGLNHLFVTLEGDAKKGINRDAIGAIIIATTPTGDHIWRQVSSVTGYMSVHPKEQHFGLGKAKSVDLRIIWPNGLQSEYKALPANGNYHIRFGDKTPIEL